MRSAAPIAAAALVTAIGLLPGTSRAQKESGAGASTTPPSATRPVTDGLSASLIVRQLVDHVGKPDAAATVRHVVEIGEPNDAPKGMRDAARWVKANRQSVEGTAAVALPASPWGAATVRAGNAGTPTKLYLHVFEWHASGRVIAYGLNGDNVKKAYLLARPQEVLKIDRSGGNTAVEASAKNVPAPDPADTVVVLELDGAPVLKPVAVMQGGDGSVALHASAAVVVGRTLRFEPEPNKNTLGYWSDAADWAYWEFKTDKPGSFDVELLQGCGKGQGGSEIEVTVDKRVMPMVVQDTGGFQTFVPRIVGQVKLEPGSHRVEVKAKTRKANAVMDLRQVTLKPAGA